MNPPAMSKFYITTPIYYVNASPHIGHAYTSIIGDCLARYKRLAGEDVFYLTGTDEHGEKIKQAASSLNEDVEVFVDRVKENFKDLWKQLNISYDYFIRTTDPAHKKSVQDVIRILYDKGDIYKSKYQGFYCLPCETFWTGTQVKDSQGKCALCGRDVEEIEEENYFFRLSKYEQWLKDYLKKNPDFIQPKIRYNEVKGFLDNNTLSDLCISRPKTRVSWGIEFPLDKDYVVYVWFDALLNYISAVGFGVEKEKFNKWWPADIHFIGKDILRHHAIFWPIMLRALEVNLPRIIFAHGWWKIGQEKMSKSKGNIVNPLELIKDIPVDALRYFLLREIPLGSDGDFSRPAIVNRMNSDLANDLGNLVHRVLNMAEKYFQGDIDCDVEKIPVAFLDAFLSLRDNYPPFMDKMDFCAALDKIFSFIKTMNKYIEDTKPWTLWKENKIQEIKEFLYVLLEGIRISAVYLYPFMPQTAEEIYKRLGLSGTVSNLKDCQWAVRKTYSVTKETPLFPRIEDTAK